MDHITDHRKALSESLEQQMFLLINEQYRSAHTTGKIELQNNVSTQCVVFLSCLQLFQLIAINAIVVLWIRSSAVRRQERGETPQSIDAVDTAIISKCH